MNKKKEILFNVNNFLLAMSLVLDKVEQNTKQTTPYHLKRVAYLALKIGEKFNLSNEQLSDLCAYALAHSVALYQYPNALEEYCTKGQTIVDSFPLLTSEKNIIKYHKEHYDGSGVFGLSGDDIPLFAQIIGFCDLIDTKFDLCNNSIDNKETICKFIKQNEKQLFSLDMSEIFCDELSIDAYFWLDLQHEQQMLAYIFQTVHDYSKALTFEQILEITTSFEKMVHPQSKLQNHLTILCKYYELEHKDTQTLLIAASLCQIGKMTLPQSFKEQKTLSPNEHNLVQSYPYYTKMVLDNIMGFSDISAWASRVQERVNGQGYPYSLDGKMLSFKDRLLASLVVYESLTNKTYNEKITHENAINLMEEMGKSNELDSAIIKDITKILV